jgi:hypothetical protein
MRAFFLAAIVLSVYFALIKVFTEWKLFLALAALTWLVLGAVLVRFRAAAPFMAMAACPVLLALCWAALPLITGERSSELAFFGPTAAIIGAFALSWGVVAGFWTLMVFGVARLASLAISRRFPDKTATSPQSPVRFAIPFVLMRVALSAAVSAAAFSQTEWVRWIAYCTNFSLDLPYAPYFTYYVSEPRRPAESLHFVISTACYGAVLHFVLAVSLGKLMHARRWPKESRAEAKTVNAAGDQQNP